MVQRVIKIPKHGGPDGHGFTETIFDALKHVLIDKSIPDEQVKDAIELCLSISKQQEWNELYRPQLLDILQKDSII